MRPRSVRRRVRRRLDAHTYRTQAQHQLRRFRRGSAVAVAVTALLLLAWGLPGGGSELEAAAQAGEGAQAGAAEEVGAATRTIRDLALGLYAFLPRLLLALLVFGAAALLARLARALIDRTLGAWDRRPAATALVRLVIFLAAGVAVISILAGDVRAAVGSLGLLGLAASWALQTPIESFTGWLLNSFRGYYRVGDRISVGDVFGDVYRIDVLTTTVWEAGGPGKPVSAAQATGALITFPNWEVLRSNIVNYSRDFPFVWDETSVNISNDSDLDYCVDVFGAVARRVFGEEMVEAAERYQSLLRSQRLLFDVDDVPRVYVSLGDSWTVCTIRYLVPVRARRSWASRLLIELSRELKQPEHAGRIVDGYPRAQVFVESDGLLPS